MNPIPLNPLFQSRRLVAPWMGYNPTPESVIVGVDLAPQVFRRATYPAAQRVATSPSPQTPKAIDIHQLFKGG